MLVFFFFFPKVVVLCIFFQSEQNYLVFTTLTCVTRK